MYIFEIIINNSEHIINGRMLIMIDLKLEATRECNDYLVDLAGFLDKVYDILSANESLEITKTYIKDFGIRFDNLVKFIKSNSYLNEKIFSKETDLKFALESFGEALHRRDYELCGQILKYELKYILFKWQSKIRI